MSTSSPPSGPPQGGGDPWTAFGYLVAGVAVYGTLGWGLATWLHARFLIPVGIIVGAMLGIVMVVYKTGVFSGSPPGAAGSIPGKPESHPHERNHPNHENQPGQSTDDRGDSE